MPIRIRKIYIKNPDGDAKLATLAQFIEPHQTDFDEALKPGDAIELEEGIFKLNAKLVPVYSRILMLRLFFSYMRVLWTSM